MELNYVIEFVELVKTGKFSDAADQLFISQSSLSKHMKVLEEELDVELFRRETKRRVQLTKYGELYYPYAEQIAILHKEYLMEQQKQKRELAETLRIGSIPAMGQYRITDILAKFQEQNSGVILHVEEMESAESVDRLLKNQLQFAFVREFETHQEDKLCHIRYTSDRLAAVLPASHPLAGRSDIALQELEGENFLLLRDTSFLYAMCLKECFRAGFEPNVIYTGSRGENIVNMVGQGAGVALLTRQPIAALQNANVRIVDIEPAITTDINLVYCRQAALSRAAQRFLEFFNQEAAMELPEA